MRRPLQGLGSLYACVPRALPVGWYEAGSLALRTRPCGAAQALVALGHTSGHHER